MALNEADKLRIEEEEKYRIEVKDKIQRAKDHPKKSDPVARFLWIVALVLFLLLVLVIPSCRSQNRTSSASVSTAKTESTKQSNSEQEAKQPALVNITFTSDPVGATLTVNGQQLGVTPIRVQVQRDKEFNYEVSISDDHPEFFLYKTYRGKFLPKENRDISVWIDRTTAVNFSVDQRKDIYADLVSFENKAWYIIENTSLTPSQWLDQIVIETGLDKEAIIKYYSKSYDSERFNRRAEPGTDWAFSPAFLHLAESIISVKYNIDEDGMNSLTMESIEKAWPAF